MLLQRLETWRPGGPSSRAHHWPRVLRDRQTRTPTCRPAPGLPAAPPGTTRCRSADRTPRRSTRRAPPRTRARNRCRRVIRGRRCCCGTGRWRGGRASAAAAALAACLRLCQRGTLEVDTAISAAGSRLAGRLSRRLVHLHRRCLPLPSTADQAATAALRTIALPPTPIHARVGTCPLQRLALVPAMARAPAARERQSVASLSGGWQSGAMRRTHLGAG